MNRNKSFWMKTLWLLFNPNTIRSHILRSPVYPLTTINVDKCQCLSWCPGLPITSDLLEQNWHKVIRETFPSDLNLTHADSSLDTWHTHFDDPHNIIPQKDRKKTSTPKGLYVKGRPRKMPKWLWDSVSRTKVVCWTVYNLKWWA